MSMAFLDNPTIILAHIRQSHVTSDDSGMCEMVLIDHDVDLEKCYLGAISAGSGLMGLIGDNIVSGDVQSCDLSQSVDITSSWDFGIRRRSNTGRSLFITVILGPKYCALIGMGFATVTLFLTFQCS